MMNEQGLYMQKIAEVIAGILKLDVTIVDKNLNRIAGTGYYLDRINTHIPCGSSFDYVLRTGKQVVVPNVGQGLCLECPFCDNCNELAHVCCPILIEQKPVGVLGLVAFNNEQRDRLLSALDKYKEFLNQICDLIATKIREDEIINELLAAHSQINTIIQTVNEGMMLVNAKGKVTYCNKASENILKTSSEYILDRYLKEIFNGTEVCWPTLLSEGFESRELSRVEANNIIHCIVSCKPVLSEGNFLGAVINFNPASALHRLFGEFSGVQLDRSFDTILGTSKAIMECKRQAALAAKSNSTVLITGETGTGKDLLARAIHSASNRRDKPFITINCGAIPETLLESELFGYEQGAFTGANKGGKPGKFQLADGGTLFLDEIGDMPLILQVKLLRVLQEGFIERVGGINKIAVDVRIIAATNRNLEKMVEQGEFREDLFYRLNVIPIEMPPLRERAEDIELLLHHFLEKYAHLLNKPYLRFSPEALQLLRSYSWPGNVRELENTVEYAVNMAADKKIALDDLTKRLRAPKEAERFISLAELEKKQLEKALNYYGNSVEGKKKIAEVLGISVATVYRKLKYYQLCNGS